MHDRSTRRSAAVLGIAILAVAVGAPALAQDESPAPDATSVASGELASLLPVEVRGLPLEPATFGGSAILENADMDDPEQAQDAADFQALLDGLGADVDQVTLVSASAFDEQGGVIAFGTQIAGVEAGSFTEPWARLYMRREYEEPRFEAVELGGKPVLSITDDASSFRPPSYAYASGDVVWLLLGDEPDIIEVLEALP